MRLQCWNNTQLAILDMTIDCMADDLSELNPRFDSERFKTTARYRQYRTD